MLKRLLPRTLFGRSLLIIVTPVVLLQIVATYVFYERHWDSVTRRLALGLAGDVAMLMQVLREVPKGPAQATILASAEKSMQMRIEYLPDVILPNAPPPAPLANRIIDRMLRKAMNETVFRPYRIDSASFGDLVEIRVQLKKGVIRVLASKKRVSSPTTYIFVMWMVGTSLVLLTVAILFLRNQIRPIRRLATAAESFGKGRLNVELKPSGAREVRQAAAAFINMRDRIQRQIAQRTEMLAGVSHDLRTPLTRMKLQLAMLDPGAEVEKLKSDVGEMERMVEGYLAFARDQDAEATVDTDLAALLDEVVEEARTQGTTLELNWPEQAGEPRPIVLPLKPGAFKRCLTNLIDNARRYAERIAISVEQGNDHVELTIDDDGPGIAADQHEYVFRPFHRVENSRNPATGGMGLGLSIARDVMRGHGGEITLSEAPLGGLRARLRLPL
ncbi:MAG: ATP-binding protein [Alphaproteobacteria bacterium]|nr:ATP-binding protein [Alphaproteobacteria bacterium]